jgi:ribosomal protein S12 methylthiotransferase accessory factor
MGPTRGVFQSSTNGLAGGNTLLEAVTAALYELIERDAKTLAHHHSEADGPLPPLDLAGLPEGPVTDLVEAFAAAGVAVQVHDVTSDLGVPTFEAIVFDQDDPRPAPCSGSGTHLDPEIALIRALTEAAQSRVVLIAGSRDDTTRHRLRLVRWSQARAAGREPVATVAPELATSAATPTFEGDVHELVGRLDRIGCQRVVVLDLSHPELAVPVVKVHVPGLEGDLHPRYRPGRRARAVIAR